MTERKQTTTRWRVLIVQTGDRWWRRWRWSLEEEQYVETVKRWVLRETGRAPVRSWARDRATRRIGEYTDVEREEALIVTGWSYEKREKPPSPIPAEFIEDPS